MAESQSLYLGPRLKRLRRELGLTQQEMAENLEVSPSYIALLERNQRPLTASLLLRLAQVYRLDMAEIASDDSSGYARRLTEAARDPIFADIDLPALEMADLATNFPGMAEAFLRLHGAYLGEQRALAEQRAFGGGERHDPVSEARRFMAEHRNFFPAIDARAEALCEEIAAAGGLETWLRSRGVRVRFLPSDVLVDSIRRFDRHNEQLLIDDSLDAASRSYQLAVHVAFSAMRSQIGQVVREGTFSGESASNLVRRALGAYAAAALIMPYTRFAQAVEQRRYDIEALARLFGASFEQVAHRLTTLNKPGEERVPFFFIRVDEAGNVSKRLDGAGFPFAAHAGGCPLWNVHSTFRRPGELLTQWLELPDGQRYFSIARTVRAGGGAYGRPTVLRAIALACAAEHAPRLVYAQGEDPRHAGATPIGITCSLCQRAQCTVRAVPPIGREVLPDDYRRAAQPFAFSEN